EIGDVNPPAEIPVLGDIVTLLGDRIRLAGDVYLQTQHFQLTDLREDLLLEVHRILRANVLCTYLVGRSGSQAGLVPTPVEYRHVKADIKALLLQRVVINVGKYRTGIVKSIRGG